MTITEFLLARIGEDEGQARSALEELESCPPSAYDVAQVPMLDAGDPSRVLAECEAKRRIVTALASREDPWADLVSDADRGAGWALREACRSLAQPFADHPDYQDEWRQA